MLRAAVTASVRAAREEERTDRTVRVALPEDTHHRNDRSDCTNEASASADG